MSVRSLRDIEANRTTRPRPRTLALLADGLDLHDSARQRLFASVAADRHSAADQPPGVPDHPKPAQLPADLATFVGRRGQLAALDRLRPGPATRTGPAIVVSITGWAGVGKTALAVHWAHTIAHDFPDGQLYVDLRGGGPAESALSSTEVLRGFLEGLAVPTARVPATPHAMAGLYRSLLAGRRFLVVLDNARDLEQITPVLPGSAGCLTVVTGRDSAIGRVTTDGISPLLLDLPPRAEAWEIFVKRVGVERATVEAAAAGEIVERCHGLPLMLALVASYAAARPELPLAALAAQLATFS